MLALMFGCSLSVCIAGDVIIKLRLIKRLLFRVRTESVSKQALTGKDENLICFPLVGMLCVCAFYRQSLSRHARDTRRVQHDAT